MPDPIGTLPKLYYKILKQVQGDTSVKNQTYM
jgi:hypothetical protein